MDKLEGIPAEKRLKIIEAALNEFGRNGYKKTSVNDVAVAAGISKSMVFHYFGSKKGMYEYLAEYSMNYMMDSFKAMIPQIMAPTNLDFFERIRLTTRLKMQMMREHSQMMLFIVSLYKETEAEVQPLIQTIKDVRGEILQQVSYENTGEYKFKDGVEPSLVMKMLNWMVEGYVRTSPINSIELIEALSKEFEESLDLMKRHFYKEEYL